MRRGCTAGDARTAHPAASGEPWSGSGQGSPRTPSLRRATSPPPPSTSGCDATQRAGAARDRLDGFADLVESDHECWPVVSRGSSVGAAENPSRARPCGDACRPGRAGMSERRSTGLASPGRASRPPRPVGRSSLPSCSLLWVQPWVQPQVWPRHGPARSHEKCSDLGLCSTAKTTPRSTWPPRGGTRTRPSTARGAAAARPRAPHRPARASAARRPCGGPPCRGTRGSRARTSPRGT